jgi:hypothetical protein
MRAPDHATVRDVDLQPAFFNILLGVRTHGDMCQK